MWKRFRLDLVGRWNCRFSCHLKRRIQLQGLSRLRLMDEEMGGIGDVLIFISACILIFFYVEVFVEGITVWKFNAFLYNFD